MIERLTNSIKSMQDKGELVKKLEDEIKVRFEA
jgi:hypothetical protein